jgi:Ca2+-transporting ATPase
MDSVSPSLFFSLTLSLCFPQSLFYPLFLLSPFLTLFFYTKGAAEVIVACSTRYTDSEGRVKPLTAAVRADLLATIDSMAKGALRTVALGHRELVGIDGTETAEELESDLTIDAIFGIKDPLRPDVSKAVSTCQAAGIFVRMVTGDNIGQ